MVMVPMFKKMVINMQEPLKIIHMRDKEPILLLKDMNILVNLNLVNIMGKVISKMYQMVQSMLVVLPMGDTMVLEPCISEMVERNPANIKMGIM